MYTYMETFHLIDAGRVLQNMQLAAWNHGIGSGLFTGIREEKLKGLCNSKPAESFCHNRLWISCK
jgi:nitroreductase